MADGAASEPLPPKTLEELESEHRPPPPGMLHQHEAAEQNPLRNYVRDVILGFNDGLVSVYAIVAGVAGAGQSASTVFIAGVAASVAGALSMGIGEYLSTKSQAEYYEAERNLERKHIREYPQLERQELKEFFEAKGLDEADAERVVAKLERDPERFLDVMMQEEFGQTRELQRSPWRASGVIMAAFAVAAVLPILPFAFLDAWTGLWAASGLAVCGLLAAGAIKAWVSGLAKWKSALEMAALGVAAALITYGVGRLVGVAV
jgi:VIT1/CCC1 family predicted Fe2+/Mn2+ transporter